MSWHKAGIRGEALSVRAWGPGRSEMLSSLSKHHQHHLVCKNKLKKNLENKGSDSLMYHCSGCGGNVKV